MPQQNRYRVFASSSALALGLAAAQVGLAPQAIAQDAAAPSAPAGTPQALPDPATGPAPTAAPLGGPPPQTAARNAQRNATSPSGNALGEIVVTARKRAENLQDTPISISAYTGATLRQQGAVQVKDVALESPNVTITPTVVSHSELYVGIRGQVQTNAQPNADVSVGVYQDGVYYARSYGLGAQLLDVDRVEIEKGPQGTLFGRNSTGGAINIVTNLPNYTFGGSVLGRYGNYDEADAEGVINLPIVDDKLAIRLAGGTANHTGYGYDSTLNAHTDVLHTWQARGTVLFDPMPGLEFILRGDASENRSLAGTTRLAQFNPATGGFALFEAGVEQGVPPAAAVPLVTSEVTGRPYVTQSNISPIDHDDTRDVSLTATYKLGGITLKSISAYRFVDAFLDTDIDGSSFSFISASNFLHDNQYTQELQLLGDAFNKRLSYIVGFYYFDETAHGIQDATALAAIAPNPTVQNIRFGSESEAVFGQATYHLTNDFAITGGLRYTNDDKTAKAIDTLGGACYLPNSPANGLFNGGGVCRADLTADANAVTYTVDAEYKPIRDMLLYAKTSRGYRAGGTNPYATDPVNVGAYQSFAPETVTDYEIGSKNEFFDRRARLNAAVFYSKYSDVQFSVFQPDGKGGVFSLFGNAPDAEIKGVELDGAIIPLQNLSLGSSFGYTDAEFASPFRGTPFPLTPKFKYSFYGQYGHDTPIGFATGRLDYAWQSKVYFQEQIPAAFQSGYGLLNGRVSLKLPQNNVEVAVYARNITGQNYDIFGLNFVPQLGFASATSGSPRTYGVEVRVPFGNGG